MNPAARSDILLIYGNQRLLIEEELKKELERVSDRVDLEFNLDVFECGEDALEDALRAAETLPFGSESKCVILKEAQRLSAQEVKRLGVYLDNPAESSILVITAVDLKAGAPLLRLMQKAARVREAAKRRDQIPGWIRSRFKARGRKVSGKALAYLHDSLGDDLMALEAAVEKICLYHEGDEAVELDEVVMLVAPSAERSLYELVDRVAFGDADQALKIMRRLLRQGDRVTHILGALSRRFRMLLLYRALREEGRQDADIIEYLRLPPNQAWMVGKKFKPQASRLSQEGLAEALSLLVEVDLGIKTGEAEEDFALEMAVTGLSDLATGRPLRQRRP